MQNIIYRLGRLAALLLLVFFLPVACSINGGCPDTKPYFQIQGIQVAELKYIDRTINHRNNIGNAEAVRWSEFLMQVNFKSAFHSATPQAGGASAYALSCQENGFLGSKTGVDALYLVTLQDYNAHYKQNDTLNDIVTVGAWTYFAEDYLKFTALSDYLTANSSKIEKDYFELRVNEAPEQATGTYRFKLIYILANGERFEEVTNAVTLVK